MSEILIEISCEEIPAKLQQANSERLCNNFVQYFAKHIDINEITHTSYVTPRRLIIYIENVPEKTNDIVTEKKGPAENAPKRAIEGFLKSNNLKSLNECLLKETAKGKFYFSRKRQDGQDTKNIISDLLIETINNFRWESSMRFGKQKLRWVRPLHAIMALFDGKLIEGKLDLGNDEFITYRNYTTGHWILSPNIIKPKNFQDYEALLEKNYVIISKDKRKEKIKYMLDNKIEKTNYIIKDDDSLLDEVTCLCEWPNVNIGSFFNKYLELPDYLLTATMRKNQRYFTLYDKNNNIAPAYAYVTERPENEKLITSGNNRVLGARLSDAVFFLKKDKEKKLEDFTIFLDRIMFHNRLGTMQTRVKQITDIAKYLQKILYHEQDTKDIEHACKLCKADLSTAMVVEFPELQGKMGAYYARGENINKDICTAIEEHYLPLGPKSPIPNNKLSIILALADKFNIITAFWTIDEKPSGSRDPFALRRAALGIIRICLEHKLHLSLSKTISETLTTFEHIHNRQEICHDIHKFVMDRLRQYWLDKNYNLHFINAVTYQLHVDDLYDYQMRIDALKTIYDHANFEILLASQKRIKNIIQKAEKFTDNTIDKNLISSSHEENLYQSFLSVKQNHDDMIAQSDYISGLKALNELSLPLANFFDHVMVNVDDDALRQNRLKLLHNIYDTINHIINFDYIDNKNI